MEDPTISDLATAAQSAYDQTTAPDNYTRVDELSSPDISTFRHNTNPHYIISHRGTDFSDAKSIRKDVRADLNIALGNRAGDVLHKRRTKKTEQIIKKIQKKDPAHEIHLSAHSLGGSTTAHAMATSPLVRSSVKSLNTFNSGSSAFQKQPDVSPEVRKELEAKSTHHRVIGDEISAHTKSSLIGKTKTYKSTKKPTVSQHLLAMATPLMKKTFAGRLLSFGANKALGTMESHSLSHFIKSKK
jgi:hypothetical protein